MARKLPWAEDLEPPKKRQRTIEISIKSSPSLKAQKPDAEASNTVRGRTVLSTPSKRRGIPRSTSTSPPPAPPDVEPMVEGYDGDDIYMMVEDEFQTLAQSFTRHLHHAEYKRLVKKAKEAPRKSLPEPVSPMSKKTKKRLERRTLTSKQREALDRIVSGKGTANADDSEEEFVEDPWRGTHLAGLMTTGSQEKRSLKGLERLPSSTRAARGFLRTELDAEDGENEAELSAAGHIVDASLLHKRKRTGPTKTSEEHQGNRDGQRSLIGHKASSREGRFHSRRNEASPVHEMPANQSSLNGAHRRQLDDPPPKAGRQKKKTPMLPLKKQEQVKEVSKEDRLAEMPMFLF